MSTRKGSVGTVSKNPYSILGVDDKAHQEEIKKSYRKLAKKYHPGRQSREQPGGGALQGDIRGLRYPRRSREAHAVRPDALRRPGVPGAPGSVRRGIRRRRHGGHPHGRCSAAVSSFGSGVTGGFSRRAASRPTVVVNVPFRTAALGGRVPREGQVPSTCPVCMGAGGSGEQSNARVCGGNGRVQQGQMVLPCHACGGRGSTFTSVCSTCGGCGEVMGTEENRPGHPAGSDTAPFQPSTQLRQDHRGETQGGYRPVPQARGQGYPLHRQDLRIPRRSWGPGSR